MSDKMQSYDDESDDERTIRILNEELDRIVKFSGDSIAGLRRALEEIRKCPGRSAQTERIASIALATYAVPKKTEIKL
jgi:hypothetical protein